MNERDKKAACSEDNFYKVIKGPTIKEFYEDFRHGNSVFIVMEYCSQGSLGHLIHKRKENFSKN